MASPERFELSTHYLEGSCSIQLSYGDTMKCYHFSAFKVKLNKAVFWNSSYGKQQPR